MSSLPKSTVTRNRRAHEKQRAMGSVVDAALDAFGRHGYAGASLSQIAEAAGLTKATVVHHFGSKEELWKAAVDALFASVDARMAARQAELPEPLVPRLHAVLRSYFEICLDHPAYVRIPMLEGEHHSWRSEWIAKRHLSRHLAAFARFTQRLVTARVLPDVEPLQLQNLMTGPLQYFLMQRGLVSAATGYDQTPQEYFEHYWETLEKLLIREAMPG